MKHSYLKIAPQVSEKGYVSSIYRTTTQMHTYLSELNYTFCIFQLDVQDILILQSDTTQSVEVHRRITFLITSLTNLYPSRFHLCKTLALNLTPHRNQYGY